MVPRLGTKSSNLWEPAVPCNGNLWFPGWEAWVPTSGNRQLLAMVTSGSQVGNCTGTKSSILWEPAVPCNGNLWFPRWQQRVPTFGNRQFLAMNQTQTFRYRSIKQNQAFCTGPLSKTIKLWRKCFHIILTVACNGNPWFQVGNQEFQPLGTGSSLQW